MSVKARQKTEALVNRSYYPTTAPIASSIYNPVMYPYGPGPGGGGGQMVILQQQQEAQFGYGAAVLSTAAAASSAGFEVGVSQGRDEQDGHSSKGGSGSRSGSGGVGGNNIRGGDNNRRVTGNRGEGGGVRDWVGEITAAIAEGAMQLATRALAVAVMAVELAVTEAPQGLGREEVQPTD
jgi:hypothetical protein